jgi:hypothetical protein
MATDVVKNIYETCEKLGDVQLAGVKLETADAALLDVTKFTIDQHVAMQPAAIAYYGTLKKQAARKLAALERQDDRWTKKQYALAKAAVDSGTSNKSQIKVEDIKARFVVDNEAEIEKREAQIERAQMEYDTLDSWYEAWKQKSFSIRETVAIEEDERYNSSSSISGTGGGMGVQQPASRTGIEKVRELIRKRQAQGNTLGK